MKQNVNIHIEGTYAMQLYCLHNNNTVNICVLAPGLRGGYFQSLGIYPPPSFLTPLPETTTLLTLVISSLALLY